MGLKLITPPVMYPLTLEDAKLVCRVDHDDEDAAINMYIGAATELAQNSTARQLITATYEYTTNLTRHYPTPLVFGFTDYGLPAWCRSVRDIITLPLPPLQSVTSIKYFDINNAEQTLSTDDYRVVTRVEPGCVVITNPPATADREDAITIRFVAGYGYAEDVPANIRERIGALIQWQYDNRDAEADIAEVAAKCFGSERVWRFH